MFGCQQNLIRAGSDTQAILEYLCSEATKLSNCGTYYARQIFFKTGKIPNRAQLHKVLGTENRNLHYQTVVFGWNKGQKNSANMGSKTHQKFVQIPTGRLKDRITQLCEQ